MQLTHNGHMGIVHMHVTVELKAYWLTCSVLLLILTYYDNLFKSPVFLNTHWLIWSCSSTCCWSLMTPSIMVHLSLKVQYGLTSWLISFLMNCHPSVINFVEPCKCWSLCMATCMSLTFMHVGMSVEALVVSMLNFMPLISLYFFSECSFMIVNQLYIGWILVCIWYVSCMSMMSILYWCILSIICHSLYDSFATTFLKITAKDLGLFITLTSLPKQ